MEQNEIKIVRLESQIKFMKDQQEGFSREILTGVSSTRDCVNDLSKSVNDIMSVMKDDTYTDRKGLVTTTLENSQSIRKIQEDLRVQRNLYTVVGTVIGAIGSAMLGFIKYILDR